MAKPLLKLWHGLLCVVSMEFLFRWYYNRGSVILLRSLWTAAWLLILATWANSIIENGTGGSIDPGLILSTLRDHPTWYAIVFAAVYTGLYARFSSQWQYLAQLYNQIKSKEVDAEAKSGSPAADITPAEFALTFTPARGGAEVSPSDFQITITPKERQGAIAGGGSPSKFDEWKAGFVDDCRLMRLDRHPSYIEVILSWLAEGGVPQAYDAANGTGAAQRLKELLIKHKGPKKEGQPR